jgi:hypothetical protein
VVRSQLRPFWPARLRGFGLNAWVDVPEALRMSVWCRPRCRPREGPYETSAVRSAPLRRWAPPGAEAGAQRPARPLPANNAGRQEVAAQPPAGRLLPLRERAWRLCPGVYRFPHSEIAVELVLRRVVFRRPAVSHFKRALARAHDDAATRAQGLDQFLDEDGFADFDFHCRRCAPEVAATGVALSLWSGMARCQERPILRRFGSSRRPGRRGLG